MGVVACMRRQNVKHPEWMVYACGNNEGGQLGIGVDGKPTNQLAPGARARACAALFSLSSARSA
jgi:hypothetical protein